MIPSTPAFSGGSCSKDYVLFLLFQGLAFSYSLPWALKRAHVCQLKSKTLNPTLIFPPGTTIIPPIHSHASGERSYTHFCHLVISNLSSVHKSLTSVPTNPLELFSRDMAKSNGHSSIVIKLDLFGSMFCLFFQHHLLRPSFLGLSFIVLFNLFHHGMLFSLGFHPEPVLCSWWALPFPWFPLHPPGDEFWICVCSPILSPELLTWTSNCLPAIFLWMGYHVSHWACPKWNLTVPLPCHHSPSPNTSLLLAPSLREWHNQASNLILRNLINSWVLNLSGSPLCK